MLNFIRTLSSQTTPASVNLAIANHSMSLYGGGLTSIYSSNNYSTCYVFCK